MPANSAPGAASDVLNSGIRFTARTTKSGASYFMLARSTTHLKTAEAWAAGGLGFSTVPDIMDKATDMSAQNPKAALSGLVEGKKVMMPSAMASQNAALLIKSGTAMMSDGTNVSVTRMPDSMRMRASGGSGNNGWDFAPKPSAGNGN